MQRVVKGSIRYLPILEMTNSVNDIFQQASQGSVAAIIQVLNECLSDCGVRTRAIFENGVLQLLCEAATSEQLDVSTLPERIRKILEAIAPRSVRRVNINSRIVREQQLLWLEEINRDPDGQVLWSKEIVLKQPNTLKRLTRDWQQYRVNAFQAGLFKSSAPKPKARHQLLRGGLIGGATVALLGAGAWTAYTKLAPSEPAETAAIAPSSRPPATPKVIPSVAPLAKIAAPSPTKPKQAVTSTVPTPTKSSDSFTQAVRLAENASALGRTATSAAKWLEIAARWRQASDLMAAVPNTDPRYAIARDRLSVYLRNSEMALQKAR